MQVHEQPNAADEEKIPFGPYCYTITDITSKKDGLPLIHTQPCGYFEVLKNGITRCKFLQIEDDILLQDGCKICGIRDTDDP